MAKATPGPNVPFLVSYGEEDYFLDQDMGLARTWRGRVATVVDASAEPLDDFDIVKILESPNEEDLPRTLIVDEAQKVKESKGKSKPLREYVNDKRAGDLHSVLVAIIRSDKVPDLWAHIATKGRMSERKKLKTWDNNNEVVKHIQKKAMEFGIYLDKGVDLEIYKATGPDLYRVRSELKKLHLLVGNGNKVTLKHIALVTSSVLKAEPWDVANAVFSRDLRGAMNALSNVYKLMGDGASVPIVSGLMHELQKVIVAKSLMTASMSETDIAGVIGVSPFRCKGTILPNARKHDAKALAKYMSRLCRLDADVKGSSRSKRTLVELAVLSIAG